MARERDLVEKKDRKTGGGGCLICIKARARCPVEEKGWQPASQSGRGKRKECE